MIARALVCAAVVAGTFAPIAPAPVACAGERPRAVLVVDTEQTGGQYRYCVVLPDDEVSGIDLIVLAHEQHGLSYRLGFGGEAVCMLAGVGTEGDDCFAEYPDFWGYWRGDGSGGWSWSSSGAGSSTVENGDVEGWSWGRGTDGSSHPAPPPTAFGQVCEGAVAESEPRRPASRDVPGDRGSDRSDEEPSTEVAAAPSDASSTGDRAASKGSSRPRVRDRRRPPASGDVAQRSPPGEIAVDETVATDPPEEDGPPVTGLLAVAAAALLFVTGGIVRRRRLP
ncbi:MAG: hypothetical protein M3238_07385 [Actinomycetota bacterium]|nr:hypothetical protein [Actinomycetota bacterium]